MSLLKVENATFTYSNRVILEDANFQLNKGEHIGLVGPNGEGKSTFVKIITGNLSSDKGKVSVAKRTTIGYLDQYSNLTKGKTVFDCLKEAFKDMFELEATILKKYEEIANVTDESIMNEILEDIGVMQSILDSSGFYNIDNKIKEFASGLGIPKDFLEKDVTNLSGGQRSKVLLAKLLLSNPSILVLDEPTNFLDIEQIKWLENFLNNYENAFILISHDIPFLNRVVNVIYHLEDSVLTRYTGNYDDFIKMHEIKKEHQNIAYERQQKEIKKLEEFIAKNKARVATTNMAKSRQKILDKMEIIDKAKEIIKPTFMFLYSKASGKFPFVLKDLVIGYDTKLSKPINLVIERGRKICISGVNGIGKTTLLKTMLGLLKPISGNIEIDYNLEYRYFEQEVFLSNDTALDYFWSFYPHLTNQEVRGKLAMVGLNKDKIESIAKVLSGGEQARIRLLICGNQESNCLILDEPTNHLDVYAKEALKEALKNYKGTIILVCHEEEFYQGLVDEVIDASKWSLKSN